jgi:hypothetical protein
MADLPLKYRRLRVILKTFSIYEDAKRGKGSERMFVGIVDGRTDDVLWRATRRAKERLK